MSLKLFASTAKGIEPLLYNELKTLGAEDLRETRAGVYFTGTLETAYRVCLWSRLANNLLHPLIECNIDNAQDLYDEVYDFNWLEHFDEKNSFKIDVVGKHSAFNNNLFAGQKIKDAIVDNIRDKKGTRPNVSKTDPDITIQVVLSERKTLINISLAGKSLHRRGYRDEAGKAPMKETLAAAILMRSKWIEDSELYNHTLYDPMCGSGTVLIEAAMMSCDIAPNIDRSHYGFSLWKKHDDAIWSKLLDDADARQEKGLENNQLHIMGSDIDKRSVNIAKANIKNAGLEHIINVRVADAREVSSSYFSNKGLIIFNPPYGERLYESQPEELQQLMTDIAAQLKLEFIGWRLNIFTGMPESTKKMGIRLQKQYQFFNGLLPTKLLCFELTEDKFSVFEDSETKLARKSQDKIDNPSNDMLMLLNRLKKNIKHISRWARKEKISCYRMYDADIPSYSFAVDNYEGEIHLQEYEPAKIIDDKTAETHTFEMLVAVSLATDVPLKKLHLKVRRKQRGKEQYQKVSEENNRFVVKENSAKFYVNLTDYLDTGLFIDHRLMRKLVADNSFQKRVLNLFSYTCTASVQAVLAGAKQVTSVDMSNTYLSWGEDNFELNNIKDKQHNFIQADCLQWIKQPAILKYDVIFLDPPTFSNSKRMEDNFDVQRDHVDLIIETMRHLKSNGTLYFSNNYRRFKMDYPTLERRFLCNNISKECLSEDFKRRENIHHCFTITYK